MTNLTFRWMVRYNIAKAWVVVVHVCITSRRCALRIAPHKRTHISGLQEYRAYIQGMANAKPLLISIYMRSSTHVTPTCSTLLLSTCIPCTLLIFSHFHSFSSSAAVFLYLCIHIVVGHPCQQPNPLSLSTIYVNIPSGHPFIFQIDRGFLIIYMYNIYIFLYGYVSRLIMKFDVICLDNSLN